MDVSNEQCYIIKFCEIKKFESGNNRSVERGFPNRDRKLKSRTLLTLYCTKSWWEKAVTDNQGLTGKGHKYKHVIIKRKELISTNSLISEQKTAPSGLLCGPNSGCFGR